MGHKLTDVDIVERKLSLQHGDETLVIELGNTRVIDCTGCWSKVRKAIQAVDASFEVDETPWNVSFRLLFTPDNPTILPLEDRKAHYIVSTANVYASRVLDIDSKWVFCLCANLDDDEREWMRTSEASDENIAGLKAHLEEHAPGIALPMINDSDEFRRFFARRGFGGQVVHVSRLTHLEQFVLLGDSAHSVFPATGEGINSSLEDGTVLIGALEKDPQHWFGAYNRARLADAQALSRYAKYLVEGLSANETEKHVRTATMITTGVLKRLGLTGNTIADQLFGKLGTSMTPYATIVDRWQRQEAAMRPLGQIFAFIPNLFAKS